MRIDRSALAVALGAALCTGAAQVEARGGDHPAIHAARGAVLLKEATSRVQPGETRLGDVIPLLRADASAAIAAIDWGPLRLSRRYAVSATVTRLSTTPTGERSVASSCAVSAAVRDLDTGNLLFIVEGRARAEDSAASADRAERDALRAAVRGAVAALPDGLRKSR